MSRQRTLAKALANTVNAVHESVNLSEVLDFIMGSMANVIPHDLAEVLLIEYDHVHIARSRGYSQLQLSETVLPIDQPISQIPLLNMMLSSHQTLLISDLQGYKADNPIVTVSWLHGYVGAPLLWQQRVIGFINLMSTKRDFFAPEHAERLTIFAAQAALAIRNARLHQEAQQAAVLQERQRLARDLHDAVSQSLYTSNVIAESLQILYQTHPSKVPENLEKLHILNRGALAEMRTLLLELRPEKLEATAMAELLQQLADAARARTGLRSKVIVKEDSDIPSDLKEALYRITQEAFTNIIKHANASHVHARYTYRDGAVKLVIEDDGQGFDMSNAATHRMGISNMQERMAAFGGSVEIESELGGGTVVTAVWGG
jgi:two-component system nitrate/nitrite sensor histidine kinase NarX